MNLKSSVLIKLKSYDVAVIVFYLMLLPVQFIFSDKIESSSNWIIIDLMVILSIISIAEFDYNKRNKFLKIVHYWYPAPLILLTFKQIYFLIPAIRPVDYDFLLIRIDRWIFGTDPTKVLHQISFPFLTEILQIIYGMFYLLPIILGLALLKKNKLIALDFAIFSVVYGFLLSYIGYFTLPGVGPRFTLHDFNTINEQLPGLWLTNFLREIVNTGESIPAGTPNPAAVVQRDVFPSGHTMITLIVIYLSIRLKSRSRFFFIPVGSLLIFSTVYLWYHYVIDLIAGAVFMIFSVWSGKYIFNAWRRFIGQEEFDYGKVEPNGK
ncbi:MAG: phosphatase PAP2 family protein [Ignavibacteriaceae bacterium]